MMKKIMVYVRQAHSITHPLFMTIFSRTWADNRQWIPDWVLQAMGIDPEKLKSGQPIAPWMECVKELVEYFDFIQKIMGGAVADIFNEADKLFT